jgi:hypothetical protein
MALWWVENQFMVFRGEYFSLGYHGDHRKSEVDDCMIGHGGSR